MSNERMGAFICHCGGNISDYVDVNSVRDAAGETEGVVVARDFMFACSDAAQQEMCQLIKDNQLDGIIVASCSPKLHQNTFREMARRAGLNPYVYNQVNIREQCSWAHRHDRPQATSKATRLVSGGLAKTRLSHPLHALTVETIPAVLVLGAGVSGMRTALSLADMGLAVTVVERASTVGGQVAGFGKMFPHNNRGQDMISGLLERMKAHENITLFTGAELVSKAGSIGNFTVELRLSQGETSSLLVGAIIVATGFDNYLPKPGEYGFGNPGVVTLPEYKAMVDAARGPLKIQGRVVKTVAYIYCVGSRQSCEPDNESPNLHCSRYCCSAAVHAAILASENDPDLNQVHFYRDMRTYGKHELLFEEAGRKGSIFAKFSGQTPPVVEFEKGKPLIRMADDLMAGQELELEADLVVLVTGMVPREMSKLHDALKLPLSSSGFLNEIHMKLRPVETVIDGVFIAGAAQGPKTLAESVASGLAAGSKAASMLLKGNVELSPLVANVDHASCTWCGECASACPYEGAVFKIAEGEREVAAISPEICKGCGGCVPVCPSEAIGLEGLGGDHVRAMIDAMTKDFIHA